MIWLLLLLLTFYKLWLLVISLLSIKLHLFKYNRVKSGLAYRLNNLAVGAFMRQMWWQGVETKKQM